MDEQLLNSLDKYFTRLSQVGYMDYIAVYQLLVMEYLVEIKECIPYFTANNGVDGTNKVKNLIANAVDCLIDENCMLGFQPCFC